MICDKVSIASISSSTSKTIYYSNEIIGDAGNFYSNYKDSIIKSYIDGKDYSQYLTYRKLDLADAELEIDTYFYQLKIDNLQLLGDGKHNIKYVVMNSAGKQLATTSKEIVVDTQNLHIYYETHVEDIGWQKTTFVDGKTAGTTGQKKQIEAIKIRTSNLPSGVKITYQAHVANVGWMNWVSEQNVARNYWQAQWN